MVSLLYFVIYESSQYYLIMFVKETQNYIKQLPYLRYHKKYIFLNIKLLNAIVLLI